MKVFLAFLVRKSGLGDHGGSKVVAVESMDAVLWDSDGLYKGGSDVGGEAASLA